MRFLALVVSLGMVSGCGDDSHPVAATPVPSSTLAPSPSPPAPSPRPPGLTAIVSGIVTDLSQRPLSGASVEWAGLAEAWGDRGHGVTTGANGAYTMGVGPLGGPGSVEGLIWMRATRAGYLVSELRVQLNPTGTTVNFTLTPVNQEE